MVPKKGSRRGRFLPDDFQKHPFEIGLNWGEKKDPAGGPGLGVGQDGKRVSGSGSCACASCGV